eukprot:gene8816-11904_t
MPAKIVQGIIDLYSRRPLLMNSLVGGVVYVAGEIVVQINGKDEKSNSHYINKSIYNHPLISHQISEQQISCQIISESVCCGNRIDDGNSFQNNIMYNISIASLDWNRITELGLLGIVENGFLMLFWYNFLNRYIGSGVGTLTVLMKCILDQLCFATQQDGLFLGICAYNRDAHISTVWEELKHNFVTTWINDCALWPIVNFIGFSMVPCSLQPTYMSTIQFFWQIYISNVANSAEAEQCHKEVSHFDDIQSIRNNHIYLLDDDDCGGIVLVPKKMPKYQLFELNRLHLIDPKKTNLIDVMSSSLANNRQLENKSASKDSANKSNINKLRNKGLKSTYENTRSSQTNLMKVTKIDHIGGAIVSDSSEAIFAINTRENDNNAREQAIAHSKWSLSAIVILAVARKLIFKI